MKKFEDYTYEEHLVSRLYPDEEYTQAVEEYRDRVAKAEARKPPLTNAELTAKINELEKKLKNIHPHYECTHDPGYNRRW